MPPDLITLYGIYRDYAKHEDDLINHRSSWHNAIQGFLFAANGLAIREGDKSGSVILLWLVPLLGCVIGAFATVSIFAADKALNTLVKKWTTEILTKYPDQAELLPGLVGGGSEEASSKGKLPAMVIPIFMTAAWLILLAVRLCHLFH